jgi:hypothetical protein
MNDEFEIRLTDAKSRFIEVKKAEMAFVKAQGEYQSALETLFRQAGVKLDQQGNFVILDVIDKVRAPKSPIVVP